MIMRYTVHLFAGIKELAAADTIKIDLPMRASVADLRAAITRDHPLLAGLLSRSAVARNHDFVDDQVMLVPGDEIAIIPAVSGG